MAAEHVMFKFDDLKVNSRNDKMTDRMTTTVLRPCPRIKCDKMLKGKGLIPTSNNNNDK